MRKLAAIGAVLLALTTGAQADYYRHHHYHGGGGGGDWAAPLVGGLIIGGILGNMAAQPRYDYPPPNYGYYVPQTYCRWQPVYDVNGWYMGQRRYCWQQ